MIHTKLNSGGRRKSSIAGSCAEHSKNRSRKPLAIKCIACPFSSSLRDIDEYKTLILEVKDQLARNLTEKLLAYGTGAAPTQADKPQIEIIISRLRDKNYGFKALIHEVVQSALFQSK